MRTLLSKGSPQHVPKIIPSATTGCDKNTQEPLDLPLLSPWNAGKKSRVAELLHGLSIGDFDD